MRHSRATTTKDEEKNKTTNKETIWATPRRLYTCNLSLRKRLRVMFDRAETEKKYLNNGQNFSKFYEISKPTDLKSSINIKQFKKN